MRLRGAIFDADGTLLDSLSVWDTLGGDYLRSIGYAPREGLDEALRDLSLSQGASFFAACMPVAVGCLIFGIMQGRMCATGLVMLAKRPNEISKSIILAIMVEFYAILALLATFLMLNQF